jgi:thiol-disulfide isomerase/thioredoxin
MATPENSKKRGPRPLLALLALAAAVLVAALAWRAWQVTEQAAQLAAARPLPRPPPPSGPPPPPDVPYNELVPIAAPVPAPPIDLPTADGRRFSLAGARGQVVLVNFWATWCPPCVKEMPGMVKLGQALARKYPGKFQLVAVSVDEEPGALQRFFGGPPYGGPPRDVTVALEPGAGVVTRAFYCTGRRACRPDDVKFPESYIVDRQGRIAALVVGDIDWSIPSARRYLESLIEG